MGKKAIIGFKGVALAPLTENTVTGYKTGVGKGIPYAGAMTRTPKESSQTFNYDDSIYAALRDVQGEDVEIRFAEIPLATLEELGLGKYNETTHIFEGDFTIANKEYALGCVTNTLDGLPFYFRWRCFELTGIRFGDFTTKGESVTISEVVINGMFKRPTLSSAKAYAIKEAQNDADLAACDAWLAAAETLPVVTP